MLYKNSKKFDFKSFSKKSKSVILCYADKKFIKKYQGLVCHGAVRSSKTFSLSIGQVLYVNNHGDGTLNLWGGVTAEAIDKNYVSTLIRILKVLGFAVTKVGNVVSVILKKANKISKILGIRSGAINYFEIIGGDKNTSTAKIQGRTYFTIFIDEFAKCNKNYVKMAETRPISFGALGKRFFSCNPEGSKKHWAFMEYVLNNIYKAIHWLLEDNKSLTKEAIKIAKSMFKGVFKKRMIYGEWVGAEGLVYDCVKDSNFIKFEDLPKHSMDFYLSLDYGNSNAFSCGLWGKVRGINKAYRIAEYYYSAKLRKVKKSAVQYISGISGMLRKFGLTIQDVHSIVVDPSAPIKVELADAGLSVVDADNNVSVGIEETYNYISTGQVIVVKENCENWVAESEQYIYDEKASSEGEDKVVKMWDHAMDETRYFVNTILKKICKLEEVS